MLALEVLPGIEMLIADLAFIRLNAPDAFTGDIVVPRPRDRQRDLDVVQTLNCHSCGGVHSRARARMHGPGHEAIVPCLAAPEAFIPALATTIESVIRRCMSTVAHKVTSHLLPRQLAAGKRKRVSDATRVAFQFVAPKPFDYAWRHLAKPVPHPGPNFCYAQLELRRLTPPRRAT